MRGLDALVRTAAVTAFLAGAGLGLSTITPSASPLPVPESVGSRAPADIPPAARPDSLARRVAARDPFRLSRAAALVAFRFGADAAAAGPAALPTPPRPPLALAGVLLGGGTPAALIDGLPGIEGTRVMRPGERVGVYELRWVTAEAALIAAPDTAWTLRVRRLP